MLWLYTYRLFTQQGQIKKLFTNLMTRRVTGVSVIDESLLKSHAKVVMNALGACVECLDDSGQLTKLLIGIGERHAMYSVTPDLIPVTGLLFYVNLFVLVVTLLKILDSFL